MIRFTKMHGIGNDYIYVDCFDQDVADPVSLSKVISDRHTGIGGDGLILLLPPEDGVDADIRMRMFNADGSESEMCGNGIRCLCKLAYERERATSNPMRIQTGAGVLSLNFTLNGSGEVQKVTVDMGEPILQVAKIPVVESKVRKADCDHEFTISVADTDWNATFVSMGNPHAVIFHEDDSIELAKVGPMFEHHPAFPNRVNVHFVQVHSKSEATMKTWERGSGITLACGTGACAVCVAGVLTGRLDRKVKLHLPGGDLDIEWRESNNHVYKTGPAVEVFTGTWND